MSRYNALSLIPLPRVGATAAVALGAQVLSAAEGRKQTKAYPKELTRPLDILSEKHALLAQAVSAYVVGPEPGDPSALPQLDQSLDGAWSGTDDRLLGMSKLTDEPRAPEAAAMRARLFPGGLLFLTRPYKEQWAESKARLDRIDAESLGPALDRLCGKEFLPAIRKAHAAYGDALGLSAPTAAPVPDEAGVRGPLDAFMAALRRYVTKGVAHGDDDTAEGAALMTALLWPLDTWTPPPQRRGAPANGGDPPTPGTPTAGQPDNPLPA